MRAMMQAAAIATTLEDDGREKFFNSWDVPNPNFESQRTFRPNLSRAKTPLTQVIPLPKKSVSILEGDKMIVKKKRKKTRIIPKRLDRKEKNY